MKTKQIILALCFLGSAEVHSDNTLLLEPIIVEGIAPPGNGLLTPQDASQSKSVISRSAIEQQNTSNNAFQVMNLLPGINTYSFDASGLFGGGLRMRGFNSDQIGVSIDGAPINDAGNFAVFPSELVDLENLEEITVTQGSGTVDTPMVGATGGSIGLNTSAPTDKARIRMQQSYVPIIPIKAFCAAIPVIWAMGALRRLFRFPKPRLISGKAVAALIVNILILKVCSIWRPVAALPEACCITSCSTIICAL